MCRYCFILLFITGFYLPLNAQTIGGWEAYTSLNTVVSGVEMENGAVWVLTTGGIALYENKETKRVLTTIDGLTRLDGTALAYDEPNSKLFVSYLNGIIDVIDTETFEIVHLDDIERSVSYSSKTIHDLLIYSDTLLVATDFGIVNYDLNTLLVRDTYTKLGTLKRAAPVFTLFKYRDLLLAGTNSGLASVDLNTDFSESEWTIYDEDNGFVSGTVTSVGMNNDILYATANDLNYKYDGSAWSKATELGEDAVIKYQNLADSDNLLALTPKRLYIISAAGTRALYLSGKNGNALISKQVYSPVIVIGMEFNGLAALDANTGNLDYYELNGPYINQFEGINFDDGTMISGTSRQSVRNYVQDQARGYTIFNGESWHNVNYNTNDELRAFNSKLFFTTLITDDYYYFGSWGSGVVRHSKLDDEIKVFDQTNSTLRGWVINSPNYPVITGMGRDSNGDVWLVSRFGTTPLYLQNPGDNDWKPFEPDAAVSTNDYYENLYIDSFDRKWIPLQNSSTAGTGLLILDTGESSDSNDDIGKKLTTGENTGNLPHNKVNAIIEDKSGEIWIGTERGIARFLYPELIMEGSVNDIKAQWLINEDTTAVSRYLLRDVNVSALAVNSANEKWIGSKNQGIWLVNEEGSRIIEHFTKDNSPLFSNTIVSIAINNEDGKVYIATDAGLLSYGDIPRQPVAKMKALKVFPNPFSYDKHSEIRIDGLAEVTTINIIGADGTVVNTLNERGGRVAWDGRDFNGNKLGSGVYYVIATSDAGGGKGSGKVIIIN